MTVGRAARIGITFILLVAAFVWICRTSVKPERITLFITAVIGAVTTIYALFTYEILQTNVEMAKAASESSKFMEQSLRFSHAPKLLYETTITKDPTFKSWGSSIIPFDNPDYRRAIQEFNEGGEQKEFVFAVISNRGQGAATHLDIEAIYNITDGNSPNRDSSVTKRAVIQILDPQNSIGMCIFISKQPGPDDRVSLVSARIKSGDVYRDANNEPVQELKIEASTHSVNQPPDSVLRLS